MNNRKKITLIITTILLIGVISLVMWCIKEPRQTGNQIRELTAEEINANLEANARAMASSSPDFARRMAINELPDIGNFSNYKKDNRYVYYGTDIVVGADPNTFKIIDDQFAKDKNHIYSKGRVLEDSDSSTFILGPIPKDKSNVYLLSTCENNQWDRCYQKVEGADPVTFQPFIGGYYKDKFHIFFDTKIIPNADIETFAIHDGGKYGYSYAYDENNTFVMTYDGIGVIDERCGNLDPIGGYYLKCDDKVYYEDKLLVDADVNTMIPVGVTSNYAKDSKTVYFDGEVVIGADAATFDIGDGINAKDKYHTYRYGQRIE